MEWLAISFYTKLIIYFENIDMLKMMNSELFKVKC